MSEVTNHIIVTPELLAKYFAGEASSPEAIAIDDWIAETPANRQEFDAQFRTWNQATPKPYVKPQQGEIWDNLRQQLKINPTATRYMWQKIAIAASVVSIISLAALFFLKKTSPESVKQLAFTATDAQPQLKLSDSSIIMATSGSMITYPAVFAGAERLVTLKGEAYFDITHDKSKPFIITDNDVQIKVLGTTFNIQTKDTCTTTTVYTGKVTMYNQYGSIIIPAGNTGIYNRARHSFSLATTANKNAISYVSRKFYFENETLTNIAGYLSKAYHEKIIIDHPQMGSLRLTGTFENESLEYIINVIAATLNIHYTQDKNEIHFSEN